MAETKVTVVATKRDILDPYIKILQNRSNDIDISFSSYLEPNKTEQQQQQQQQKELEDTELSIFEARSYFSESKSNDSRFNGPRFSMGHAASSEASWNSQTGLLQNNNRNQSNRVSNKKGRSKWFFRRRTCPCSSSKSVQVQETKPRTVESRTGSDRIVSNRIIHHHQNHQMISSSNPIRLTIPSNTVTRSMESKAPVSSFSFPTLQSSENLKNRVLSPIKPVLNPIKPVMNPIITTEEEATSDASSDLFEIESFSTQPAIRPWAQPVRNSIDESQETDTEYGYEPSEASVTWSVTTAEPVSVIASNFTRIGLSSSMQPVKRVSVQDEIKEKVLCNNGSSKLSLTSRPMLDIKSSFLV